MRILGPETKLLLSSSMQQALFKCETPRLELKSSATFLCIKRGKGRKIGKVIKLSRSSIYSWRILCAPLVIKLWIQVGLGNLRFLQVNCFPYKQTRDSLGSAHLLRWVSGHEPFLENCVQLLFSGTHKCVPGHISWSFLAHKFLCGS
jgi:hypothetical protein